MKSTYLPLNMRGFKAAFSREASPTDTSYGKDVAFCNLDYQVLKKMNSHYTFTVVEEPMYY